jgi:ketosteroid isomerase-like protein
MGEHQNVERLRKGFAAFDSGDIPAVLELFSPDIVWNVPGDNPIAGTYKGHDEVMGFFGKLMEETGGSFKIEIEDILANDRHGVAIVRQRAERNGKRIDMSVVQVFSVNEDGKVTEFSGYPEDSAAVDDFYK